MPFKAYYLNSQGTLKKDPNETELYCEFFNDSILQIRGADDPDSLRGGDYFGVVLDEFAMMKVSVWEEILRIEYLNLV